MVELVELYYKTPGSGEGKLLDWIESLISRGRSASDKNIPFDHPVPRFSLFSFWSTWIICASQLGEPSNVGAYYYRSPEW